MGCSALSAHAQTVIVDGIYLIVNQQMYTFSEAQEASLALQQQLQQQNETVAPDEIQARVQERMIAELLLLDRAEALNIEASRSEVESRIDRIRDQNPQLFRATSESLLQDQIANEIKKQRLLAREVDPKVRVTDGDVQQFCQAQAQEARQVKLSQILLRGENVAARVRQVQRQFTEGAEFAELARTFSDDPNASDNGGTLGTFRKGELLKEIEEAAFALPVGELSQPVQTTFGTHLLLVSEEQIPQDFNCAALSEETRDQYEQQLFQQRRQSQLDSYLAELREKARITVNAFPEGWNG